MTTQNKASDSTFYLSPFCCICLENINLYPLDSCDSDNISYTFMLYYCFPEKEKTTDKSVLRYICDQCTLMVTLTYKFKLLYYQNTAVTDQYLQEFKNISKNKFTNLVVSVQDVKPFLSPENTVKVKSFDPSATNQYLIERADHEIVIKEEILDGETNDEFQLFINEHDVNEVFEQQDNFLGFPTSTVKCTGCNVPKNKKQLLLQKICSKKKFSCNICHKIYAKSSSLNSHKLIHKKRISCEFCKSKFVHLANYEQHLKNHNPQLQCPNCPKLFTTTYYLRRHLKTHEEKGQKCVKCDKNVVHLSRHNCQKTTNKCQQCKVDITNGKQHICAVVAIATTVKCDICDLETINGGQHNCIPLETCVKCNQKIIDKTKHVCKQFKCHFCPKEFLKKPYLYNHLRFHLHPKKFKCIYCNRKFNKAEFLRLHLKNKHSG